MGALFGGTNAKQRALTSMDEGKRFTFENLKASGMSDADAIKFLGSNYSPLPRQRTLAPTILWIFQDITWAVSCSYLTLGDLYDRAVSRADSEPC